MPRRSIRKRCFEHRCPYYALEGSSYCASHKPPRSRTTTIGQSSRWRALRRRLLDAAPKPLHCAECGKVLDDAPDHGHRPELDDIEPVEAGGAPFDEANLQWLCMRCNGRKRNKVEPRPSPAQRRRAADAERRNAALVHQPS